MTSVDFARLAIELRRYQHLVDEETGLPRWGLLIDRTAVALARARRSRDAQVAFFVLDDPTVPPDHDVELAEIAKRVLAHVRPDDTVARIGYRCLAVVCNDIRLDEDAAHVARRLFFDAGIYCTLGASLSQPHDTAESLIARALEEAARTSPAA
jgi:GGDEF domain-containing protein